MAQEADSKTMPQTERVPLSHQRVLAAALQVIDSEGLEALSMRRLGAELGVDPMAIYRHVDGKEAVLDGVAELLWTELPDAAPDDGDWLGGLRAFAHSLRGLFHTHPHAAPLLLQRAVLPIPSLEKSDAQMETLRQAGFDSRRAAEIVRTIISFSTGYGWVELACMGAVGMQEWRQLSEREKFLSIAQALPAGTPARLADVAVTLWAEADPDVTFESGIELILAGAQAVRERPLTGT